MFMPPVVGYGYFFGITSCGYVCKIVPAASSMEKTKSHQLFHVDIKLN